MITFLTPRLGSASKRRADWGFIGRWADQWAILLLTSAGDAQRPSRLLDANRPWSEFKVLHGKPAHLRGAKSIKVPGLGLHPRGARFRRKHQPVGSPQGFALGA